MVEVAAFLILATGSIAFLTIAAWILLQVHNELTMKKLNNAIVEALAEGSYRNSYRYRSPKGKK